MNNINIKHLKALMAVAHHEHFTRAAEVIGLSQPALSNLIAQLERELGVKLLVRTTRTVEVTPAGRDFLRASEDLLRDLDKAIVGVREYAAVKRGSVAVAALPSLCTFYLPKVIAEFQRRFSKIPIKVLDLPGDEVTERVLSREVDFGLGYLSTAETTAQPILVDHLLAVCPENYGLGQKGVLRWSELVGRNIIAMAHGTTIRRLIDQAMQKSKADLRIVLEPDQIATALAYARAGLGIAILPSTVPASTEPGIKYLALEQPRVDRTISIIENVAHYRTPAAAAFIDVLENPAPF